MKIKIIRIFAALAALIAICSLTAKFPHEICLADEVSETATFDDVAIDMPDIAEESVSDTQEIEYTITTEEESFTEEVQIKSETVSVEEALDDCVEADAPDSIDQMIEDNAQKELCSETTDTEPDIDADNIDADNNIDENAISQFCSGYASLTAAETILYAGSDGGTRSGVLIGDGVVYVTARGGSSDNMFHVRFFDGESVSEGWASAHGIHPLDTPGAVDEYLSHCTANDQAVNYDGILLLPVERHNATEQSDEEFEEPLLTELPAEEIEEVTIEEEDDASTLLEQLLGNTEEQTVASFDISFDRNSAIIGIKDNTLCLKVAFSDGKKHECDFTSSKTSIVSVEKYIDEAGDIYCRLTGKKAGSATVYVTCQESGFSGTDGSCKVKVCTLITKSSDLQKTIPSKLKLVLGESKTASVAPVFGTKAVTCDFASSDSSVVTVDESGNVTAKGIGAATITVSSRVKPSVKASCAVEVWQKATSLSFNMPEQLGVGMQATLEPVFEPFELPEDVTFSLIEGSSVSLTGDSIMALPDCTSSGIIAHTPSGITSNKLYVTVVPAPTELVVNKTDTLKLGKGTYFDLWQSYGTRLAALELIPSGSLASFKYTTDKKSVATVDANGVIKAVGVGTAHITVTSTSTSPVLSHKFTVSVLKAASSISVTPAEKHIGILSGCDDYGKLAVSFPKSSYDFWWLVDDYDRSVVQIDDATGAITPIAPGHTVINIETLKGKTASCDITVDYAPDALVLPETLRIAVGDKTQILNASYDPSCYCDIAYRIRTGDSKKVLSIGANTGKISALAAGTVTVEAYNVLDPEGTSTAIASCGVTIVGAPTKVSTAMTGTISMGVGDTLDIADSISVNWPSGEPDLIPALTYSSSSKKIAKVDENGVITAQKAGSATITVKTFNEKSCKIKIKVLAPAQSAELLSNPVMIGEAMQGQLAVGKYLPKSSYSIVRYYSDDESIATIDPETGIFLTKEIDQASEAVFHVESQTGTVLGSCTVPVKPAPAAIRFEQDKYTVYEGKTCETLVMPLDEDSIGSYHYMRENPEIATVDENGIICGLCSGTAHIVAQTQETDGATARCEIEVLPLAQTLAFVNEAGESYEPLLIIAKTDTALLPTPKAFDARGREIETAFAYTESSSLLSITNGCYVKAGKTASGKGKDVKITVASVDNPDAKAVIYVRISSNGITNLALSDSSVDLYIDPDNPTRELKPEHLLEASLVSKDVNCGSITFVSSNSEVASIDENGLIAAHAPGKATIVVKTPVGKKSATCAVSVYRLAAELRFEETSLVTGIYDNVQISPVFEDGYGAPLYYETADSSIATVDENGLISGVGAGSTTIHVYSIDAMCADIAVRVLPGPDSIEIPAQTVYTTVDGSFDFSPSLYCNEEEFVRKLSYSTSDAQTVTINADTGRVSGVKKGSAIITATTVNGLSASCRVMVVDSSEVHDTCFTFGDSAVMVKGYTEDMSKYISISAESINKVYVLEAADGFTVDGMKLTAVKTGEYPLKLMNRDDPTDYIQATLKIIDSLDLHWTQNGTDAFTKNKIQLNQYTSSAKNKDKEMSLSILPANLLCSDIRFEVADEALVTYDVEAGIIRSASATGDIHNDDAVVGTTVLSVKQGENTLLSMSIDILPVTRYYALIITEWNKIGSVPLPFAQHNANLMQGALKLSSVNGEVYHTTIKTNPSKSTIKSTISSCFGKATANDVCVLYICCHGQGNNRSYRLHLPNESYISTSELQSYIKDIRANLVFYLDTCYSGDFITESREFLTSHPNISVATCQDGEHQGAFISSKPAEEYSEFGTFGWAEALGYGIRQNWKGMGIKLVKGENQSVSGYLTIDAAITKGTNNASSAFSECCGYPKEAAFIKPNGAKSAFNPQKAISSQHKDIILVGRES